MQNQDRPIAFFDSGLGGISVLRETVRLLPQENYLYYGDSLHAPYGVRPEAEIRALAGAAAEQLVQAGAKALVVACNTATSAAIVQLREAYPDIPVIGTEPALKPAVEKYPGGRILVMATPMTIRQEKFQALKAQYDDQAEIIGLACGGLMEFVERGELHGEIVVEVAGVTDTDVVKAAVLQLQPDFDGHIHNNRQIGLKIPDNSVVQRLNDLRPQPFVRIAIPLISHC